MWSFPRKLEKLDKESISILYFEKVSMGSYVDGFFTKGNTITKCKENIDKTMILYDRIMFFVNLGSTKLFHQKELKF